MKHVRNVSEMVDRVAHAICKSRTCEGVSCCQWPAQGGRTNCPVKNGGYDEAARDAIEAMREPTRAMIEVAFLSGGDVRGEHYAMIDEALRVPAPKADAA